MVLVAEWPLMVSPLNERVERFVEDEKATGFFKFTRVLTSGASIGVARCQVRLRTDTGVTGQRSMVNGPNDEPRVHRAETRKGLRSGREAERENLVPVG